MLYKLTPDWKLKLERWYWYWLQSDSEVWAGWWRRSRLWYCYSLQTREGTALTNHQTDWIYLSYIIDLTSYATDLNTRHHYHYTVPIITPSSSSSSSSSVNWGQAFNVWKHALKQLCQCRPIKAIIVDWCCQQADLYYLGLKSLNSNVCLWSCLPFLDWSGVCIMEPRESSMHSLEREFQRGVMLGGWRVRVTMVRCAVLDIS